jgi:hypothetical protein
MLECLNEAEVAIDLTGYSVAINVVWGDDEDERIELTPEVTALTGEVIGSLTADQIELLPDAKKTKVFLVLTPPSANPYTTPLGRITVRDA